LSDVFVFSSNQMKKRFSHWEGNFRVLGNPVLHCLKALN